MCILLTFTLIFFGLLYFSSKIWSMDACVNIHEGMYEDCSVDIWAGKVAGRQEYRKEGRQVCR